MKQDTPPIARTISGLSVALAIIVALIIPCGYISMAYHHIAGTLEAEAELNAGEITELINDNPQLWIYQESRLNEMLRKRPLGAQPESRQFFDATGRLITESVSELAAPVITRSHMVMDAGAPAGRVAVSRSLRPMLNKSGLAVLVALALSLMLIVTLRLLPFQSIIVAERKLRQRNEELATIEQALRDQLAEHKQSRDNLFATNQALQALFTASPLAIITRSVDGKITMWNPAATVIFGWSAEEVIGTSRALAAPDGVDEFWALREMITHKKVISGIELQRCRKDGKPITISLSAAPMFDANGKVCGIVSVCTDITERKLAEQELRRWSDIYQHTSMGITVGQPDSTVFEMMNSAYAEMHGYTVDELIGRPIADLYAPSCRDDLPGYIQEIKENGHHLFETWHQRKDGSIFPVMVDATTVRDEGGELLYRIVNVQNITKRKEAEEALLQSQLFAQRIIETTPNLIYIYDLQEQRNLYANQELPIILGYSRDEVKAYGQELFARILHPDDLAKVLAHHARFAVAADGEIFEVEYRMRHAGGEWVTLRSRDVLFARNEDGTPRQIIGTAEDITRRKQTEEALQDSLALMEKTFSSLDEAVFIVRTGSREIIDYNSAVERLFGYGPEELVGSTTAILHLNKENSDWFGAEMLQSYQTQGYFATTFQMRRKDGTVFDSEHYVTPIRNSAGEITSHVCVVRDVTARKAAEDLLLAERNKFEAIVSCLGDGLSILDRDFRILYQNRVQESMVGGSHAGRFCYQAYHDGTDVCVDCPVVRTFADGGIHKAVRSFARPEGEVFFDITASPLRDAQGGIVGAIELARDVTSLRQAADELEQRVVERTDELAARNRDLEAFSYSVSHDLRAPLRHINGYSRALQEECAAKLAPQEQHYLDRICLASKRMSELIDDLLNLADVSRAELSSRKVDLSDMARTVANECLRSNPARQANFAIADGMTVLGDPPLLRSVLDNLLGNAWKYTGKAESASIEFGCSPRDGEKVYFVRDNGVGFDMAHAEKLFGPFQRLHTVDEFEGTGIGLATVKRIIERHGGQVWAEAEPGAGATFYFTLPA